MAIETLGRADVQTRIDITGDAVFDQTYTQDGDATYDIDVTTNPQTPTLSVDETNMVTDNRQKFYDAGVSQTGDWSVSGSITLDAVGTDGSEDSITLLVDSDTYELPTNSNNYPTTVNISSNVSNPLIRLEGQEGDFIGVVVDTASVTVQQQADTTVSSVTQSDGV